MPVICADSGLITLINVFTVTSETQQPLLKCLEGATASTISKLPGFVSASFHRSLDGRMVVNYAQWQSLEAFKAMFEHPEVVEHLQAIRMLASGEKNIYEVASVFERHGLD
jgi:heme-degrading monooxygenase HmoA